ncbi:Toprim domain-containing protein [Hephaestia caeni]|uniref:Toprim domain-containing protein n=1 Tax=Hephaestia caeni TaxID=645617 RepID=A0A397PIT5_9SPHN|nr:toprim domain-containing protein [Hephaestia caeni]RIA46054.1 Toprim domain-containing protein [Hephaestia caeni]
MALSRTSADPRLHAAAARIVKSLGVEWRPSGVMCRCPAHKDNTPSLSVRVGERSILFKCFAGCSTIDVMRALRTDNLSTPSAETQAGWGDEARERRLNGRISSLWKEARPVTGTPADNYLSTRGFAGPHPALRYHDRVPLGRGTDVRFRPALLAAAEGDLGVIALERLFLDPCTGLPVNDLAPPKRMLGRPHHGAVRFGAATRVLGLAEGWETAWSAHILLGIPVWAAFGSERFPLVAIPERIEHLILLPDDDAAGRRGAQRAAAAHQGPGRRIETRFPGSGFNDWNDRYQSERGGGGENVRKAA